jgi:hypothetical protein
MDDPTALAERVARLEAANATLARQLEELRDLVDRAHAGGFRSIRDSRRCPACGGGAFLHVPKVTQASDIGVVPLGIHHVTRWTGTTAHGTMESFTCRQCGLVELHVIAPSEVNVDGVHVLAVDPEPPPPAAGPFR